MEALGQTHQRSAAAAYGSLLLKTGQTVQYASELDDGYYEKGVAKSYTVNTAGAQSGTTNVDLAHLVSDSGAFTSADKTYTDAGKCGVFKAAGGETVIISGSASNNGTFTTTSATADTVVFSEAITDEADVPETTFKKREAVSNNTVLDNNTGLTWLRYPCAKMGVSGDGLMPWTGAVYDIFQWCAACNAASVSGITDWRIPNINEYESLAIHEIGAATRDGTAFPTNVNAWSSTIDKYNGASRRYYFNKDNAIPANAVISSSKFSVYLVRGG